MRELPETDCDLPTPAEILETWRSNRTRVLEALTAVPASWCIP